MAGVVIFQKESLTLARLDNLITLVRCASAGMAMQVPTWKE